MTEIHFWTFIKKREQRQELYILGCILLFMGIALKWAYPYPFNMSDSGAYLLGAAIDYFNVYRPQGYSHYLRFLHGINSHIAFVFWATYALTGISTLLLLFSAKYLLNLQKWIFRTICLLSIASPSMLFSSNFLMSDGLFNLLTMLWLTTGMWLIKSRKRWLLVAHLTCFMCLYQVRFSGMFYLPISILILALSSNMWQNKMIRVAIVCLPLVCFSVLYGYNKRLYHKHTGVKVTSGFSGWQLLNNAAVLFPEAKSIPISAFKDANIKTLHTFMQNVPDSIFKQKHTMETGYMWNTKLPMKQFLSYYITKTKHNYEPSWAFIGSLYGKYATELIKQEPWKYFKKFVIPSFLSTFKFQEITEEQIPFRLDKYAAPYYKLDLQEYIHKHRFFECLNPMRKIFNAVYWTALMIAMIYYFSTKFRKRYFNDTKWQVHFLTIAFIIIYIGVSVLASPNTTWRYSMPIFVPSLIFIGYLKSSTPMPPSLCLLKRKKAIHPGSAAMD